MNEEKNMNETPVNDMPEGFTNPEVVEPVQPVPTVPVEEPVVEPQPAPTTNPEVVEERVLDDKTVEKKKSKSGIALIVIVLLIMVAVIAFLPQISEFIQDII